jgi:phosphoserine phosphatase RsbU/P
MQPNTLHSTADLHEELRQLALLEGAAHSLNSTLDLDELLEKIVSDVAVAFGCSRSAVLLVTDDGKELELVAVRGWTMNVHPKGFRFRIGGEGLVGRTAKTGLTSYVPDVLLDPVYVVSEETTRSELDIPLKTRGKVIGLFNAQHPDVDAFPESRRNLLEALAEHVSTAVENARLYKRERLAKEKLEGEQEQARQMQIALLPDGDFQNGDFLISGKCAPMRAVGGDWFDFFALEEDRIAVVLGDVSGKGVPAALLMASARSTLRQQTPNAKSAGEVLQRLNRILLNDFPRGNFVTAVFGILDIQSNTLELASAGHPPPVLSRGKLCQVLDISNGLPLGIREEGYENTIVAMEPGTALLMYSDGLLEATDANDEEFGLERIVRVCAVSDPRPDSVISQVREFSASRGLSDDATALVVSRGTTPP